MKLIGCKKSCVTANGSEAWGLEAEERATPPNIWRLSLARSIFVSSGNANKDFGFECGLVRFSSELS